MREDSVTIRSMFSSLCRLYICWSASLGAFVPLVTALRRRQLRRSVFVLSDDHPQATRQSPTSPDQHHPTDEHTRARTTHPSEDERHCVCADEARGQLGEVVVAAPLAESELAGQTAHWLTQRRLPVSRCPQSRFPLASGLRSLGADVGPHQRSVSSPLHHTPQPPPARHHPTETIGTGTVPAPRG